VRREQHGSLSPVHAVANTAKSNGRIYGMILVKSRFLTTGQVWFDDEPTGEKVDVLLFRQRSSPITSIRCVPFHTIVTDLRRKPEEILSSFSKDTRYEIRRGESKDLFSFSHWQKNEQGVLQDFLRFYGKFAQQKGLPAANERELKAFATARAIAFSCCRSQEGEELVWHVYYTSPTRVRLLYSASLYRDTTNSAYRSMIGRANRFLHWQDMLFFKSEGVMVYDFGGWYAGNADKEKISINKFKEEFGGTVVKEYNCEQCMTLKARIVTIAGKLLKR